MSSCVVLAGGLGTRLREAVADVPKCLAPVGRSTFLELQLAQLHRQGVQHFVLSLGHRSQQVVDAVAASPLRPSIDTVVEAQPLGTGGGVWLAMRTMGLDECLVANGDTWLDGDLSALHLPLDLAAGEWARLGAVQVPDRRRYGGLALAQERVLHFLDAGAADGGWINAGIYRLHRRVFEGRVPGASFSLEREVLPALLADGHLCAARLGGRFIDIGVPDDYRRFCDEFA
jgi:D-glycero-alpha-D-manno-heptose 1-phosphate guanylyltransferase